MHVSTADDYVNLVFTLVCFIMRVSYSHDALICDTRLAYACE